MPYCPNCNEFYFGSPDMCPNCNWSFAAKRVLNRQELNAMRDNGERVKQDFYDMMRNKARVAETQKQEEIKEKEYLQRKAEESRKQTLRDNPLYEYSTEFVRDNRYGVLEQDVLNDILNRYAQNGWRLHSVFVNESGKNMSTFGIGGVSSGTNATMDTTILVFERCVKPAEYK